MRLGSRAWSGFRLGSFLWVSGAALLAFGAGCDSEDPGAPIPPGSGGSAAGGTANTGGIATTSGGTATSGGVPGTGNAPGSGGLPTSGGAPGSGAVPGGSGGLVGTGGGGSCNAPVADPGAFPACDTCSGGRCVPKADFPDIPSELLDGCGAAGMCAPDSLVATKGEVLLGKCSSVLGNEGRCTSLCIPFARELSAVLPQDTCAGEERCAPCFNPNDGAPTGLCNLGCDPGPTAQPILFTKCCGGRGDCIPRSNIPGNAKDNLAPETCTGNNDPVCVPSAIVENPAYRFPSCESNVSLIPGTPGTSAGPGVCVPDCIVNSTQFGANINQGNCGAGDKCVPCNDPRNGQPSGACIQ